MSGSLGTAPPAQSCTIKPADRFANGVHQLCIPIGSEALRVQGSQHPARVGGNASGKACSDRTRERTTRASRVRPRQSRPPKLADRTAYPESINDLQPGRMSPL